METVKAVFEAAYPYLLALALAFVTEGSVEYLCGTPLDKLSKQFPKLSKLSEWKWALIYVSLIVGLALAFSYHLDIFAVLSGAATVQGIFFTGVAIGRGANYVHELISKYILVKPV